MTQAAINELALEPVGRTTRPREGARSSIGPRHGDEFLISITRNVDAALVVLSLAGGYVLYVGWHPDTVLFYAAATAMSSFLTLAMFRWVRLYDLESLVSRPALIMRLGRASASSALLMMGALFALKASEEFSRVWLAASHLASLVLICGARELLLAPVRARARGGRALRRVALVGANPQAHWVAGLVRATSAPWREIVGVFDDRATRVPPQVDGHDVVGSLEALTLWVRQNRIDEVIVTLPLSAGRRVAEILDTLRQLPVHVYLGTDLGGHGLAAKHLVWVDQIPVLEIGRRPLTGWDGLIKTAVDKLLAAALLLALTPAMVAIAALIRLDSAGPALFRQQRYGFNNERITVLKFRTMREATVEAAELVQARRDDPRVTRVGSWLRRTSLDELPQLINVLEGSMSLVGPRPHAVQHNELFATLVRGYHARHKVRPGITGWAQINGLRGETSTVDQIRDRVEHDIFYIENWSLRFDVKILLATLVVGWRQRTAY